LRAAIEARKAVDARCTFAALAQRIKVQRSYFTNVLRSRGSFSQDQLFALCQALGSSAADADHLALLLEIDRCQLPERRKVLVARRDEERRGRLRTEAALQERRQLPPDATAEYYSDPYCPLAHVFFSIPPYASQPWRVAQELGVTPEHLDRLIKTLERVGVLAKGVGGDLTFLPGHVHLPKESWLHQVYTAASRHLAVAQCQKRAHEADYFFSSSFSCSEATRRRLHATWLAALQSMSDDIQSSDPEQVYHVNFDLFRVGRGEA
jgi:hypothetical protein